MGGPGRVPLGTRLRVLIPSRDTEVLIVGAGPTGLVLALWLTRMGVRVRIVDKTAEPGTTSRALAVQARTLEFYAQIGLAEDVVRRSRPMVGINLWVLGRRRAHVSLGAMGAGISPFPYPVIFPQDEHEPLLIERLSRAGIAVERSTELRGFEMSQEVVARLRMPDGTEETCRASWIAGCDGARSTVREGLGITFPGGTYEHLFYVADVEAKGAIADGELHVGMDRRDFLAVFPLKEANRLRLVGTVSGGTRSPTLTWEDVGRQVLGWLPLQVTGVSWFSTYHVHHRVAGRFRKGRAFLLGDAAHIHSPVGGQGMNTGIGDAVNLAWKLAWVARGRAEESLLDTYEPERIAFARRLVDTTDQGFTAVTSRSPLARFLRLRIGPALLPLVFACRPARRFLYRTVSQTNVNYRGCGLSEGRVGPVHGGDRLPWVKMEAADNFDALTALDWQVHVYGEPPGELRDLCAKRGLSLYVFPWRGGMRRSGVRRNAVYLVRPDGYVASVQPGSAAGRIGEYLEKRRLAPRGARG